MAGYRDDSAGGYGQWNDDDLSWLDYLKAKGSDIGGGAMNAFSNITGALSPIGTSPQGNMALQVPPMISGIADSYSRLAGTPSQPGNAYNLSGVPELDAPIQGDMSNVLLSLYGGNALNPLAKRPAGSVGAGMPVKAASQYGDDIFTGVNHGEAYQQAVNRFGESAVDDMLLKNGHLDGFIDETGDFIDRITARERVGGTGGYHAADLLSDTGKPSIFGSAAATAGEQPRYIQDWLKF